MKVMAIFFIIGVTLICLVGCCAIASSAMEGGEREKEQLLMIKDEKKSKVEEQV